MLPTLSGVPEDGVKGGVDSPAGAAIAVAAAVGGTWDPWVPDEQQHVTRTKPAIPN